MLKYNRESSKEDLTNNNANATTTTTNRKLTTKEQEQEKKREENGTIEFERAAKRLKNKSTPRRIQTRIQSIELQNISKGY